MKVRLKVVSCIELLIKPSDHDRPKTESDNK